jgi:hypothetical protein
MGIASRFRPSIGDGEGLNVEELAELSKALPKLLN